MADYPIINLSQPVTLRGQAVSEVKVTLYADTPGLKRLTVNLLGARRSLLVWEGADYDAHRAWSEADVATRVDALRAQLPALFETP